MDDDGSSKKKKKRGKSAIFKYVFRKSGNSRSSDDPSSPGKALASDDNLIYCDVTANGNGVDSDQSIKKPNRGRMSKIFKAVLFDTAVKKKTKSKKSMKVSASTGSSPIPYDYPSIEDSSRSFNEDILVNSIMEKVTEPEDDDSSNSIDPSNSNDPSSQIPLSPKTAPAPPSPVSITAPTTITTLATIVDPDAPATAPAALPPVTSSPSPPIATAPTNPPMKLTSRVDSMKKKPPLPPYSRVESIKKKPTPATTTTTTTAATTTTTTPTTPTTPKTPKTPTTPKDRKPAKEENNSKVRLCLLIILSLFVTVVLWTIYTTAIATEPSDINPDPYTDIVTTGDEL